jgi:hypothetical protein
MQRQLQALMQGKIVRNFVSGKARAAIALATWSLFHSAELVLGTT